MTLLSNTIDRIQNKLTLRHTTKRRARIRPWIYNSAARKSTSAKSTYIKSCRYYRSCTSGRSPRSRTQPPVRVPRLRCCRIKTAMCRRRTWVPWLPRITATRGEASHLLREVITRVWAWMCPARLIEIGSTSMTLTVWIQKRNTTSQRIFRAIKIPVKRRGTADWAALWGVRTMTITPAIGLITTTVAPSWITPGIVALPKIMTRLGAFNFRKIALRETWDTCWIVLAPTIA